ncbi:MAG: Crp/Fnr family transcriptional regulator [Vulcanimicrobiaceae bacterium]
MSYFMDIAYGDSGNLFLDSLDAGSFAKFDSYLEHVVLPLGTPIASAGEPSEYAVFPTSAIVSAVTTMSDGLGVEVLLVGREGFYGLHFALAENVSRNEAMIQIAGAVFRMRAGDFRRLVEADASVLRRTLRYAQATLDTVAQFSACNRLHPTSERCARWLLMAHDRVPGDEVALTHEYLALMLGVRRPGVSIAAATMEEAGFIRYRRGLIEIVDRVGLEAASCECYGAVNVAASSQLGYDIRKRRGDGSELGTVGSLAD